MCQKSFKFILVLTFFLNNAINAQKIKVDSLLSVFRSDTFFYTILTTRVEGDSVVFGMKYIVSLRDSSFNNYLRTLDKDSLGCHLSKYLKTDKLDWEADILLYWLYRVDASDLIIYYPNGKKEWKKRKKRKDIIFWGKYFKFRGICQ